MNGIWYLLLYSLWYNNFIVCHPLHFVRHLIVILQIVENSSFLILCNILHHHQILFSLFLFLSPLTNKLSIVFTLFVCLHACYLEIPNNRDPWIIYKCFPSQLVTIQNEHKCKNRLKYEICRLSLCTANSNLKRPSANYR